MVKTKMASQFTVTAAAGEACWTLQCTHEWEDYEGRFKIPETGLLAEMLKQPEAFQDAFSNREVALVAGRVIVSLKFPYCNAVLVPLVRSTQTDQDKQIRRLTDRVRQLETEVTPPHRDLQYIDPVKFIKPEDMIAYCRTNPEFQKFLREQVNTTEAESFKKWIASLGVASAKIYQMYMAKVQGLSMYFPDTNAQSCIAGLYGPGRWLTEVLPWTSVQPEKKTIGPFWMSSAGGNYIIACTLVE